LVHTPSFLPVGPQAFFPSESRTQLLRHVPYVVTVSRATARYVGEHAGLPATVISFPVYDAPPATLPEVRNGGCVTIINPCAVKGIAIFHGTASQLPDLPFSAVPSWGTTASDRQALDSHRNVEVLAPRDNVDELLSRTRILMVPSLWHEAFGLVVVEAMARGIVVVTSDSGGLPEAKLGTRFVLPVRPIDGYLDALDDRNLPVAVVPTQDIGPWSDTIRLLCDAPDLYREEALASHRAAIDHIRSVTVEPWVDYLSHVARDEVRERHGDASEASPPVDALSAKQKAVYALLARRRAAGPAADDDRD
jgi:hypothetical protein